MSGKEIITIDLSSDSEPEQDSSKPAPPPAIASASASAPPPQQQSGEATNVPEGSKSKRLTRTMKSLSLQDQSMGQFDPEKSNREKRKLSQKFQIESGKKEGHDEHGLIVGSAMDLCDCLHEACPGCFFPCRTCRSCKCGVECRRSKVTRNNASASPGAKPEDFLANKLFVALDQAMKDDTDNLIEKVRGIFAIIREKNGTGGKEGYWLIDAKTGKGSVTFNGKAKPDVTFLMDDSDVTDLLTGKLNPQKAFFQGKVKIQGNMGLAMKLQELQRLASNRIEEIRSKL